MAFQPNTKVLGGILARRLTWPTQVYITQSYKSDVVLTNNTVQTVSVKFTCGGTLITFYTILTAAQCMSTLFSIDFNNTKVYYNITPNAYYPTWESMFDIYVGV